MPPADRVLSTAEICEITGKALRTVRRWFQEGRLRRVKFAGVVGAWESEVITALSWRGTGSLVTDDACTADRDDDVLGALPNDSDADVG
jgi:hypothetical protein